MEANLSSSYRCVYIKHNVMIIIVVLLLQMSILLFNGLILPGLQWLTAAMAGLSLISSVIRQEFSHQKNSNL